MRLAGFVLLLSVITVVAPVGVIGATDLPPSPVLMELYPDRGDIGDEISFRGSGFDPQEAIETRVYFGSSLTAAPSQLTDEEIDVEIPIEAETGWVWVGVTVSDGAGGEIELTSNPLRLLVIRQEINLSDFVSNPYFFHSSLIASDEAGTYLMINGDVPKVWGSAGGESHSRLAGVSPLQLNRPPRNRSPARISDSSKENEEKDRWVGALFFYLPHNGTPESLGEFGNLFTGAFARDPVSEQILAIEGYPGYERLINLTTGSIISTWVNDDENWKGDIIDFDQSGNLFIEGHFGNTHYDQDLPVNVWRFSRPEWTFQNPDLQLDPENENALLPPETDSGQAFGWYRDMAISGDGTIYIVSKEEDVGYTPSIWRIPSRDGASDYEKIEMPEGEGSHSPGYWLVAANPCGSGAYALNPMLHDTDVFDPGPFDYYSVDEERLIAKVDYFETFFGQLAGFQSDNLGNLFTFVGNDQGVPVQYWVTPADLEAQAPNFYKNNECHTDYDCGECDPEGGSPNDCVGAPVRLSNGNMRYTERDLLPTTLPVLAVRTYDSAEALENDSAGVFGRGWHSVFDASLTEDVSGTTIHIRTEANRQVEFVQIDGVYVQTRPSGSSRLGKLSLEGNIFRYRPAGESLVRLYNAGGALSGFEDIETGRSWTVDYGPDGLPTTISDSWSDGQWVIGGESGRITSIDAPGLSLSYGYGPDGELQTVNADGLLWRAYEYEELALTKVRDGDRVIETHAYEQTFPYWATSSRTAAEDIVTIEYDVQSGTLRPIAPDKGETVTRVTNSSGYSTEYYTRPVGGRRRTVEVRGDCGCGTGDFSAYVYDGLGHVVRQQGANSSVTVRSWDHNGHLRSVGSGYVPKGCNPSEQKCWVRADKLAKIKLDGAGATTVTYSYLDPNWPDKATDICRSSVVETGAQTCTTLTFDAATGQIVGRVHHGWTWDGETGAVEEKTRTSERRLYESAESASFDPTDEASSLGIGITFEGGWATLPQPEGKLKETLGPRYFDPDDPAIDQTLFVYYPVDQAVPSALRGRLAAQMDALGAVSFFDDYDEWGNLTRAIDSRGVTTAFVFDDLGRLESQTLHGDPGCDEQIDPLCGQDLVTEYFYKGSSNRRHQVRQADGSALRYSYDKWRRLKEEMRGTSEPEDFFERQLLKLDPHTGARTKIELQATAGGSWETKRQTKYKHDSQGRLARTIYPDGAYAENTYDDSGNLAAFKDAVHEDPNVTYSYDLHRRLTEVRQLIDDTLGWAPTDYGYDHHGNLTGVTDANGLVTTYSVDDFGATCR
ncbi:MAG: DUF6531 domain-containing protein, partial [Thermoanaerobaculales bacterium]|nr:DUF6531 domain-containing protein [Thermoanaerobaculales bacterium]